MLWLSLKSEQTLKFASLQDRATIGSASSNHITIQGKGIRSLHGQFLLEEENYFYRDFSDRQCIPLHQDSQIIIGNWLITSNPFDHFWEKYHSLFQEDFKANLTQSSQPHLEEALSKLKMNWFLTNETPEIVVSSLSSQFQEVSLLGPIERILEDPFVTDVLVESFDQIWVEKNGELTFSNFYFSNPESYKLYLENLLAQAHKTLDEAIPFVDFILPGGHRGHVIAPPVTDGKYYLSIRKMRRDILTLNNFVQREMFSERTLQLLQKFIREQKNILISGATGSGKTTLLKALINACPEHEHLLVAEDTPELKFPRKNSCFLYTRISSETELPPVTLRDLVRQALRMRPDRIVIGEVRGDEALDLLHAMNTGHRGCMGSLHANSARDALYRLEGLVRMSSAALSEQAVRDLVSRNIHVVLHCEKGEGKRKLKEVAYVHGRDNDRILLEMETL